MPTLGKGINHSASYPVLFKKATMFIKNQNLWEIEIYLEISNVLGDGNLQSFDSFTQLLGGLVIVSGIDRHRLQVMMMRQSKSNHSIAAFGG
jgi:hypothetical protein